MSSPRTRSPHTPDDQDVDQPMIDLAGTPGILERGKVLDQFLHRHRHSPFVDEWRTVTPRYTIKSRQPISCVAPGSLRRSDRLAKYNQLLRLKRAWGATAALPVRPAVDAHSRTPSDTHRPSATAA